MRRYWTLFVISALVVTLLVPAVSFAGGRGGHRGGGHGHGGNLLRDVAILTGAIVVLEAANAALSPRPYYYERSYDYSPAPPPDYRQSYREQYREPICYERVPIYRLQRDPWTGEVYKVVVGSRRVVVPCD